MNSLACQNAIMDLFRGHMDDDEPQLRFTTTIKKEVEGVSPSIATEKDDVIVGGAPAADAIKDIFNPAEKTIGDVVEIDNPDKLHNIVGGGEEEEIPEDVDAYEPIEKDGDGELITEQTIEQPNNDYDADEEANKADPDAEPILITGGATVPVQRVSIITADLKFPWVLKQKRKMD